MSFENARDISAWVSSSDAQLIHLGRGHSVYRVRTEAQSVVLKLTATRAPKADAIASLRHEYELLRERDLPGTVKVLELARAGEGLALLMNDAGQKNLADRVVGAPLFTGEFLEVAVQLSEAVTRLHEARIVHRDITPVNVVWDEASRRVTLVDFGIATTLAALAVESATAALLEGTLPYISPEQTGRTGRTVDSRTDLYSLGATFYELLAGTPPFPLQDPVELVHAHIARRPRPLHEFNPDVPLGVSRIVSKLLEKEPEQRYQTAAALAIDLGEARTQWRRAGAIVPFPLALHDVSRELSIPDRLYGRDEELRTLHDAFARACRGSRELVLVTGTPGIGKSALVGQLARPAAERSGLYLAGKFDQLQRSVPFSGLSHAFRVLVRQLVSEPEPVLARWRERIDAAVTPNGQLLVEVVPELASILGPQPPVAELGALEAKNRFQLVFARFLSVFARPEHPLVLFLDDLQWVDAASLQLLEQWIGDTDNHHLLLVGAYRDNEVGRSHPLALSLAGLRDAGSRVRQIHLGPIGRDDVAQLTADALNQDVVSTRPLADLLIQKTAGNPFFVRRLLHLLHAQGLVRFAPESHAWRWDLTDLERAPLTDNVLDLIVQTIDRLPESTRTLLQVAACIGHRFDLRTLAEVSGHSRTSATDQLWPALEDGLLVPIRETYKAPRRTGPLEDSLDALPGTVQFVHDRVQQAAYSLLTEERRQALHLNIGRRLLLSATDTSALDDRLFDIVDQIDLGEALIVDPVECLRLIELNLAAGRKAIASAAYQAGFDYLTVAMRHLPERAWETQPELTFAVHRELAECAYLTGQHATAEELIVAALEHAPSKVAKADLYTLRALAGTVAGDMQRALHWGREGLAVFGHAWPLEGLPAANEAEVTAVMRNLGDRRIEDLVNEDEVADEETRACMRLLSILGPPAYFFGTDVLTFVVTRATNLSLRHGPSAYSAYAYVFYGALHNARTGEYDVGYAFGTLALALARRFGNRAEESRTLEVFGLLVHPWKAPLRDSLPLLRDGFRAGVESGELAYAAFNLNSVLINGLPASVPLADLLADADVAIEFAIKHKNRTSIEMAMPFRQLARALTEATQVTSLDDDAFEEVHFLEEAKANQTALGFFWVARLQAAYLLGDYETARRSSREGARLALAGNLGMVTRAEHVFYTALTLAAECGSAPCTETTTLDELLALQRTLTLWAEHCPQNFSHKAALVGAEIARLSGASHEAMKLYRTAVGDAARHAFVQDEALAHDLRARFFLSEHEPELAAVHFRAARKCYQRWGATVKVKALEREYPDLFVAEPRTPTTGIAIDALALVKASQAISAEMAPARLFERILRVAIEVAGAQHGALVLVDGDALTIHARLSSALAASSFTAATLDDCPDVPASIIRYVLRLKEPLALSDAAAEGPFTTDPTVRQRALRSILCVPLIKQAKVVGVLYLENDAMAGAFAYELVEVVQVLASQAVISLENSTLTERSEQQRRLYEAILASTPDLVYVFGLDYRFTYANPTLLAMWGKTWEQSIGKRLIDLGYEPWHAEMHEREIDQVIVTKRPIRGEVPFAGTHGRRIYDYIFVPVIGVDGEVEAIAGATRDVTERKNVEDDLRKANHAKDEFLALLSHELRTPLNAIVGWTHILRQRQFTADKVDHALAVIDRNANLQAQLVEDLLDVSRINTGKLTIDFRPVDLMSVMEAAIDAIRPAAANRDIVLDVNLEDDPVVVRGDADRLQQVAWNLLTNGVKFTAGDGRRISVGLRRKGTLAQFSVTDEGIGIAPEFLPHVFERFRQADASNTRKHGGLGLGLALVRALVEAHGGTVQVASDGLGTGATFTVSLPLSAEAAADTVPAPAREASIEGLKVLVVDDDPDARGLLVIMLEGLGAIPMTAASAGEALRLFHDARPDFLMSDIGMPDQNGLDLIRIVRVLPEHLGSRIPALAVTAYAAPRDRDMAIRAGYDRHLTKPFSEADLVEAIRDAVRSRESL